MKDERLTALGISLRKDFQTLITQYAAGWFRNSYLTDEDLQDLYVAIGIDVRRLVRIGFDFVELEEALTSGFFPMDLAVFGNKTNFQVAEKHSVPQSSRLFPERSAKRESYPEHYPEKKQEVSALKASEIAWGDFQEPLKRYINGDVNTDYLTEEDLQDLQNIGNDVKQLLCVGSDFMDLEKSWILGFSPADFTVSSKEGDGHNFGHTLFHSGYPQCDTPLEEGIKAGDFSLSKGIRTDDSLLSEELKTNNSLLEDGQVTGFPSWEGPGVGPFSPWNQEQHTSIKGLREFARILEWKQQKENLPVSEVDSPSYAENRERIPGPPTQTSQNYRERGAVSEREEQGWKRTLEKKNEIPSPPMLEKVPLNAQKPGVQGEFLRGPEDRSSSFQKQKSEVEAESSQNKDREYVKQPDNIPEFDVEQIMEALAQEIYREYTRFYGR